MIAFGLAAAVAARLAPPLGMPIGYHVVDTSANAAGDTRIDTGMTLRFRRAEGGALIAAARTDTVGIAAPPPIKARLTALFGPLLGATTQGEIEADGSVGALVDPEPSWQAFRASQQTMLAHVDTLPPDAEHRRTLARRALLHALDPAHRDEMLRPGLAQLLPPVLPPLALGDMRTSDTTLSTPQGSVNAENRVTLVAADPARLVYHVETTTVIDPAGGPRFAAISDVEVERKTGLLLIVRGRRELLRPGAAPIVISRHVVEQAHEPMR